MVFDLFDDCNFFWISPRTYTVAAYIKRTALLFFYTELHPALSNVQICIYSVCNLILIYIVKNILCETKAGFTPSYHVL
jgi:hypothetical protein